MQDHAVVSEQLGCMMRMQSVSIQQMDNLNRKLAVGASQQLDGRWASGIFEADDDAGEGQIEPRSDDASGVLWELFTPQTANNVLKMSPLEREALAAWVRTSPGEKCMCCYHR